MKIDIKPENFNTEVIEKSKEIPIVADFWADWCGPCRMLLPMLEKISEEYNGKFILARINVDENQTIAGNYNIMSIPAVKLFKDGKVVDEFTGAQAQPYIEQWLENNDILK